MQDSNSKCLVFPSELRFIIQIYRGKLYRRVIYWNNTLIVLFTTSRYTLEELVIKVLGEID